jgi:hypothetical protein
MQKIQDISSHNSKSELPESGCELTLSPDNQWLRLIVSGKQVAVFHVNYVNKVLDSGKNKTKPKSGIRKTEIPPSI